MQIYRSEKAKVINGTQVVNELLDIFLSAHDRISVCGNSRFPSQLLSLEITKKTIAAKESLGQRYIIEVTKENIAFCRNLIDVAGKDNSKLRHSDEIEANFIASEKEYLGSIILKEPHQQAIYSNMVGMVEQQHHL